MAAVGAWLSDELRTGCGRAPNGVEPISSTGLLEPIARDADGTAIPWRCRTASSSLIRSRQALRSDRSCCDRFHTLPAVACSDAACAAATSYDSASAASARWASPP